MTCAIGPLPILVNIAELVANMAVEERVDSLLTQIRGTIGAAARADSNISEFESALAFVESVVFVSPLQVADEQHAPRTMIGVVTKRLHCLAMPAFVISNPTIVRSELCKVANQRLHQVLRPPNRMDIPSRYQNSFITIANAIPPLSILNSPICNLEVTAEEVRLQSPVPPLEALAYRLLLVAIPPDVRASVGSTEGSLAHDFVAVEADAVRGEVCSGGS